MGACVSPGDGEHQNERHEGARHRSVGGKDQEPAWSFLRNPEEFDEFFLGVSLRGPLFWIANERLPKDGGTHAHLLASTWPRCASSADAATYCPRAWRPLLAGLDAALGAVAVASAAVACPQDPARDSTEAAAVMAAEAVTPAVAVMVGAAPALPVMSSEAVAAGGGVAAPAGGGCSRLRSRRPVARRARSASPAGTLRVRWTPRASAVCWYYARSMEAASTPSIERAQAAAMELVLAALWLAW